MGDEVRRHRVGERCLIQTDYRHLPTAAANAAFGYNFEGGLQEYVLLDERMIIEPGTGERFLIPVGEEPGASAIALVEPWACVEASYVCRERRAAGPGGRMLVVPGAGHAIDRHGALLEGRAGHGRAGRRRRARPLGLGWPRRWRAMPDVAAVVRAGISTTSCTSAPTPPRSKCCRIAWPREA